MTRYVTEIHGDEVKLTINLQKDNGRLLSPDDAEILELQLNMMAERTLCYLLNKHLYNNEKIKITMSELQQKQSSFLDKMLNLWERYFVYSKNSSKLISNGMDQQLREADKYIKDGYANIIEDNEI